MIKCVNNGLKLGHNLVKRKKKKTPESNDFCNIDQDWYYGEACSLRTNGWRYRLPFYRTIFSPFQGLSCYCCLEMF